MKKEPYIKTTYRILKKYDYKAITNRIFKSSDIRI